MAGSDFAQGKAMTRTSDNRGFAWAATSVVALALGLMLCANAFAQNGTVPRATTEEMRLWSFGDCDRRFPYIGTPDHQECVRIVSSPEARDARALRVCETSHPTDHAELERCKAAYRSNKEKAAREAAGVPTADPSAASPEVMRRVKAITTAAVEEQRAAAGAAAPEAAAPEPAVQRATEAPTPEKSTWKGTVITVMLLAIGAGLGVNLVRRKQASAA